MYGFLEHLIFEFSRKHSKGGHPAVAYFGYSGLFFVGIGLIAALLMCGYGAVTQSMDFAAMTRFLLMVPGVMLVLGELDALFGWFIWFRKEA